MKILPFITILTFLTIAPFLEAEEKIKDGIAFDESNRPYYIKSGEGVDVTCYLESETELRYVMLDKLYLEIITRFPADKDIMKAAEKLEFEKHKNSSSK